MAGEDQRCRQVGHVDDVDFDLPGVAWEARPRRDAQLRRVAIPLRPCGRFTVCEIEGADDRASLPATIGRILRPSEGIPAGADDPPPNPINGDAASRRCAQEKESFSSSLTSLDTSR